MYQDKVVLCACSAYEQKYYLNPDFEGLPQAVQEELKIMCVMHAAEAGGILTMCYDEDGNLLFEVSADEGDILFDEISSGLKIRQMQNEKRDLLESLELYYRVFFLNEDATELLTDE